MNEPLRTFLAREKMARDTRCLAEDREMRKAFATYALLTAAAALGEPVHPDDTYSGLRRRLLLTQEAEEGLPDPRQNPPATTTRRRS